jgi:hypothetical protein
MHKNNNNKIALISLILLAMMPEVALAETNLGTMFANFTESAAALTELVRYSSYIIGLFLVVGATFKFMKNANDPREGLKAPLVMAACGFGIFALTSSISIVSQTMSLGDGPGAILAPSGSGINAASSAALQGVITFVRLLGYIAVIRGWLLLVAYGNGKTDGTMGRGLVHILGGVAAIHLVPTVKLLANSVAPGLSMGWLN